MGKRLNDIIILVNNDQISYSADSLSWKDGFGDAEVVNEIVGGGQTDPVYSEDLTSKVGMVKFSMATTAANDALKRAWKANKNNNVVELLGSADENFQKIFTQAAILEDPEANAATDGKIEIEFKGNPAQ